MALGTGKFSNQSLLTNHSSRLALWGKCGGPPAGKQTIWSLRLISQVPSTVSPRRPVKEQLSPSAAEGFRPRFAAKGLQLLSRLPGPLPLLGDARRLQQLFTNLLENSQRYTDPGGRLEIDARTSADAYHIR